MIHSANKCIVHLLLGLRNHLTLITLELDALNIDIASKLDSVNLQQHKISIDGGLYIDNDVLPIGCEIIAEINSCSGIAIVVGVPIA